MDRHSPLIKIVLGAVFVAAILFAGLLIRPKKSPVIGESEATAVGLKGTSRISKILSMTQEKKLKEHFLESPPGISPAAEKSDIVSRVQAINRFNQRQSQ